MPEVATNDRRIVFVGTVREKKGVRQLVQAMPAILATVPDAELCIVGPDSETESGASYIESVLRPAMPEAVAARVRFAGRVDNTALPALLASAAVCVYPSHMEALPIAFIEGMAMGKAVVASSTGPGPEVIEHGVSGLLCDPHDPRSIAEQVTRALTDRSLRERLGRRAHEEVVARFAIDVLAKRNLDYYERCARHYRDPASRAS
jgi:glycosyltransferase involved in cell wall biosynthesis